MKRVAVITAVNPRFRNLGMLTVDLAAIQIMRGLGHDIQASFYTLPPVNDPTDPTNFVAVDGLAPRYLSFIDNYDEVVNADAIVFWGDFLQARHYIHEDALGRILETMDISEEEGIQLLYRHLLLSEADEAVLRKTLIFGSSLLFDLRSHCDTGRYGHYVKRLFRNARGLWFREPMSMRKALLISEFEANVREGMDAAFLLDSGRFGTPSLSEDRVSAGDGVSIGVFLGVRSPLTRGVQGFLNRIRDESGARVVGIPWLAGSSGSTSYLRRRAVHLVKRLGMAGHIVRMKAKLGGHQKAHPQDRLESILASIRDSRAIITDCYHLCVNSWREGVPAICLSDDNAPPMKTTLSGFKKRILYGMLTAEEFLVPIVDLNRRKSRLSRVARTLSALRNDSLVQGICADIQRSRNVVREDFIRSLSSLLGV